MKQYLELVEDVLTNGHVRCDRTGVGTKACFGRQIRFDLTRGFPLITTKRVYFKSVIRELLWLLSGSTNVNDLHPCKIWDMWADDNGDLGPVYGQQWRKWSLKELSTHETNRVNIDQIQNVITSLRNNPWSRRHIVSAWNVGEISDMALPPCHVLFQFFVHEDDDQQYLSCQMYQRSADLALGVPFNIASYAALMHMIAQQVNMIPLEFIHTFGDVHIYSNHETGLREQLKRTPRKLPLLNLNDSGSIDGYKLDDFKLINYNHEPIIKFPIAV